MILVFDVFESQIRSLLQPYLLSLDLQPPSPPVLSSQELQEDICHNSLYVSSELHVESIKQP
jgi:hypothetical protein